MAVSAVETTDIATALEELLNGIDGLRAYRYVADGARVPCIIVSLPTITWNDQDSGFCAASWEFGLSLIVSRANDRAAQDALSAMVSAVARTLDGVQVDGRFMVDMLTASPATITLSGQDLPAYNLSVRVRA